MIHSNGLKPIVSEKDCEKCGAKCCRSFSTFYPKEWEKKFPDAFSEVKRFKLLDTDSIDVRDEGDFIEVKFLFPCKMLDKNGKCRIYRGGRPLLCKEYPYSNSIECPFILNKVRDTFRQ